MEAGSESSFSGLISEEALTLKGEGERNWRMDGQVPVWKLI